MVVDDAPSVLDVVTEMLEENGTVVTAVDSSKAALESLQRKRSDVLLSDLTIPSTGGYWLIERVCEPPERGGATPAAALATFRNPGTGRASCAP